MTTRRTKAQLESALVETETRLFEHAETVGLLQERFAELELALEDTNWLRMAQSSEQEFSREGLRRIILLARLSFLKNPLIHHAVMVQAHYVWGQGVNINAVDPTVNKVVQSFLDNPKNKKEFTGHQARIESEVELQTSSNVFLVLFTDPSSGEVLLRSIDINEVMDIITDPEDDKTVWYYQRIWSSKELDTESGATKTVQHVAYYPDWQYDPTSKPPKLGKYEVKWDSPVYSVRIGGLKAMKWGVPEIYSALDWARAVKEDMEDYATIRRALSRFAWKLTTQGGKAGIKSAKDRLNSTLSTSEQETNPPSTTGATFIQSKDSVNMEPIKTAGAQVQPEEGRRMWLLVSAGTGIPETILSGDANVGNYATSRTLDRPTELQMRTRQTLWADVIVDILTYVIAKARGKANGVLAGIESVRRETQILEPNPNTLSNGHVSRRAYIALKEATNVTAGSVVDLSKADSTGGGVIELHVDFPAILEREPLQRVQAIVQAATLNGQVKAGTMSDKTLVRFLLGALGEDNIDERLQELFPGNATELPALEDPNPGPVTGGGGQSGQQLPSGGDSKRAAAKQPAAQAAASERSA
jgi:hypothetical protein